MKLSKPTILMIIIIAANVILNLSGCGETEVVAVNVDGEISSQLNNTILGVDALVEIGDYIYYDSTTGIVYWWNGCYHSDWSTSPTAYYSPNGHLYRYNPQTNTLEEVNPNTTE